MSATALLPPPITPRLGTTVLIPISRLRTDVPYRIELNLALADSLQAGQKSPITCTASGLVRDGNRCLVATRWIGLKELLCTIVP